MSFAISSVQIDVADVAAAQRYYETALAATAAPAGPDGRVRLDLRGAGILELSPAEGTASDGFSGVVLNCIVAQPAEVAALVDAAAAAGATVLKPAKKGFFGGFTAVVRAPDGSVWKIAAPTKKDTGPAATPPTPTELVAIAGVEDPKASKASYEKLGLEVERDYGSKFVDFTREPGTWRLGLMPPKELAKDAGVDVPQRAKAGDGRVRLVARAGSLPDGFVDVDGHHWVAGSA